MSQHIHGYQKRTFDSHFSFTTWVPGMTAGALLAEPSHQPNNGVLNITLSAFMAL